MNPVLRLARRIGFGHNNLRRPVDRIDGLVIGFAILAGATMVVIGVLLGLQLATYEATVAAQQQATRTATTAVLLQDSDSSLTAPARWTTTDGTVHTGPVDVVSQQNAGTSIQIWTDPDGAVVSRPIGTLDIVLMVGVLVAGGLTVAFIALRGLVCLARLPIKRWCSKAWDEDWTRTEPRWRQRRHG
jgi:hypothetical protein